jgi:hypothetical protein
MLFQSVEAERIFHSDEVRGRILVQPKAGFVAIRDQLPEPLIHFAASAERCHVVSA